MVNKNVMLWTNTKISADISYKLFDSGGIWTVDLKFVSGLFTTVLPGYDQIPIS